MPPRRLTFVETLLAKFPDAHVARPPNRFTAPSNQTPDEESPLKPVNYLPGLVIPPLNDRDKILVEAKKERDDKKAKDGITKEVAKLTISGPTVPAGNFKKAKEEKAATAERQPVVKVLSKEAKVTKSQSKPKPAMTATSSTRKKTTTKGRSSRPNAMDMRKLAVALDKGELALALCSIIF
jgi:hypothetical protein